MNNLGDKQCKVVETELETLRTLKSDIWGNPELPGPSRLLLATASETRNKGSSARPQWRIKSENIIFCHNDLSTHNVIVGPESSRAEAIIDWEYAGFFPRRV